MLHPFLERVAQATPAYLIPQLSWEPAARRFQRWERNPIAEFLEERMLLSGTVASADLTAQATSVINVSNSTELAAALQSATGGEVIQVAAGEYGELQVVSKDYTQPVIVTSADLDNRALFTKLYAYDSSNLTITNVNVKFTPDETTYGHTSPVEVKFSSNIHLDNLQVVGGLAVVGLTEDAEPGDPNPMGSIIGRPTGRGIFVFESQGVTISNSNISVFHMGIVLANSSGVSVMNNEVHHLRTSPLVGTNLTDISVSGNHFHSSDPWKFGGAGDHGDHIHFWNGSTVNRNISITDNLFQQGDGQSLVGIYIQDIDGQGFENVTITGNIIHNGDGQGIRIENVNGFNVSENTLLQSSGGMGQNPSIVISGVITPDPRNGVIRNNVSGGLRLQITAESLATITAENNITLQGFDAAGADFVGRHYFDPLNRMADVRGLTALPQSLPDVTRAGAAATLLDTSDAGTWLIVNYESGSILTQQFSAFQFEMAADPDAVYSWDFGDGSTGSGTDPVHTYAVGGLYEVALTVQNGDQVTSLSKTIFVQYNDILGLDFNNNTVINSANLPLTTIWQPQFTTGLDGTAALFTGDLNYLHIESEPELVGMKSLVIDFDVQVLQSSSTSVRPIWNHGHYGVEWSGSTITFFIVTDDGVTHSMSAQTNVQNGDWHHVQLNYDSATGIFTGSVDGQVLATRANISGPIKTDHRDLYIGGTPWGAGLNGKMDNIQIRHQDLDAAPPQPPVVENQAPTLSFNQSLTSIAENTLVPSNLLIGTITIHDDGLGNNILSLSGPNANLFVLSGNSLYLKAGTQLDYEQLATLTTSINVDDTTLAGTAEDSLTVLVSVTDVSETLNTAPAISDQTFAVVAKSSNGTFVGSVQASDADAGQTLTYQIVSATDMRSFSIDPVTGELTVSRWRSITNVETQTLTVRVTDSANPALSTEATITVNIVASNQAGTVVINSLLPAIDENVDRATAVRVADLTIVDDGLGENYLSLAGTHSGLFEIIGDGLYLKAGTGFDYEATSTLDVQVIVDDPAILGSVDSSTNFTMIINDLNEAPTGVAFVNPVTTISTNVDTSQGLLIADLVILGDTSGTNLFSLSGADAALFEVVGQSLYLKAGATLDAVANPSLDVSVSVYDAAFGSGSAVSADLTVTVTDAPLNQAPLISDQSFTVDALSSSGSLVGQVVASDPDGDQLTYEIISGDTSAFKLDPNTGDLTVHRRRKIRTPETVQLVVRVTDSGSPASYTEATITIHIV